MYFEEKRIHAANELVDVVLNRLQQGSVISDLVDDLGLSRDHCFYLSCIDSSSVQPLSHLINARSAIILNVNYEQLNSLISSCLNATEQDVKNLMREVSKKFGLQHTTEYQLSNGLVELLFSELNCFLDTGSSFKPEIPNSTMSLLLDLKGVRKSILPFYLVNKKFYNFEINLSNLTFAIRAFDAKKKNINPVLDLIKSGADYSFVKEYNGFCDVSVSYFKTIREVYNVDIPKFSKVPLVKLHDAYSYYQEELDNSSNYKEAVLISSKKSKLPIEIVVKAIEKYSVEDVDVEDELDELQALLS